MGVLKLGLKFTFYTALALAIPITYNLGYQRGAFETRLETKIPSHLERIAKHEYAVVNPDDYTKYSIDFKDKTIKPYTNKDLEKLFTD